MSTKGWTRVIVEKPFGKVINKTLDMNKLAIIYPLVIWTPLCSVYHCILDATIFWIPLYSGYNCILDTTVFWIQMYSGYKCILDTTVFWIQLYSGYNCILDTTVFWIPLYILQDSASSADLSNHLMKLFAEHQLYRYIALYCTVLYYTVLYYTVLYCTVL